MFGRIVQAAVRLELRLLLSLNKDQTLCFGECERKKQLNIYNSRINQKR